MQIEAKKVDGDLCHEILIKKVKPKLSFDENKEYFSWKAKIKEKLFELLGMACIQSNVATDIAFCVEKEEQKDGYKQIRFSFQSEIGAVVPCYLLIPNTGKQKYPIAITLQGHSTGFHNSIGEAKSESDAEYIATRGDFGVQAVKRGYASLCIEQRCMGELLTSRHEFEKYLCMYPALTALELGRTTIGERCFDVSRSIDVMERFFNCVDTQKILITGNSGGGTTSFYAACLDERIKICAPSCSFCSFEKSILLKRHCACNYIPSAYLWFEMQDITSLIAPRDFIVVAGELDSIFNIEGVKTGVETAKRIFRKENAEDKVELIVTPKGHYWCVDLVWNAIEKRAKELGWFNEGLR